MKEKIIVVDDHFEIPEEIKNMSKEELEKEIERLVDEGRRIAETLPDMKPLVDSR